MKLVLQLFGQFIRSSKAISFQKSVLESGKILLYAYLCYIIAAYCLQLTASNTLTHSGKIAVSLFSFFVFIVYVMARKISQHDFGGGGNSADCYPQKFTKNLIAIYVFVGGFIQCLLLMSWNVSDEINAFNSSLA